MKILEVDAGNTCIKWRLMEHTENQNQKIHSDLVYAPVSVDVFPATFSQQIIDFKKFHIKEAGNFDVSHIRVSNVRGDNFAHAFSDFCQMHFSVVVTYAKVTAECDGLTNAYQDFETLGVDRWLAMLTAYRSAQSAVCVVDCGSAMTIDLVNTDGQHEGGFIVPGIQLMQRSLGEQTANLPYQPETDTSIEPGTKTIDAINHGVLSMVLGMIEKVHRERSSDYQWYFCGGDANVLSPYITWQHEIRSELVLDGLAVACK
jgi:type III pantothenate kinase